MEQLHLLLLMALKTWEIPLGDGFRIICERETLLGRWLHFAVVLVKDDVCITRYDSAHGFARRDVLGQKSGLIRKEECINMTLREAFGHGIDDFKANFRTHHDFYAAH